MASSADYSLRLTSQFDRTIQSIGRARILRFGNRVLNTARRESPVDTGLLRSSGSLIVIGDAVDIEFRTSYAVYVHRRNPFVTRAVEIERRRGI